MGNLSKYIEQVRDWKEKNNIEDENLLIRYVYRDLGKRFSFDLKFLPFGNSRKRQEIYNKCSTSKEIEKSMEDNIVICKSLSRILEEVLKQCGVNIKTVVEETFDKRKCPHVYNIIIPNNGEAYSIDLQEDMYHMKANGFTRNYGISLKDGKTQVIPRFEQEQMDRKLGYIDDKNYYTDEYLYTIKADMDLIEDFREKARFVLENIDIHENSDINVADRKFKHLRILEELFPKEEFDSINNNTKIRLVDCYKELNGKKRYYNCVCVRDNTKPTQMYIYNEKEYGYRQISLDAFAKAITNGLVVHNCSIPGLGSALKRIKEKESAEKQI